MIKELKYLFFILVIFLFITLSLKYYFSDTYLKHSYRSLKTFDQKIINFSQNLVLLKNDTDKTVEYVKNTLDKTKKNYNFWELINNDE
tara:strand:+ start:979 stop:1242 length:264 start_codon:yes stop_codon:yes gene_type:complete